jgi:hypothetical protein
MISQGANMTTLGRKRNLYSSATGFGLLVGTLGITLFAGLANAQSQSGGQKGATAPPVVIPGARVVATLAQLMRGTLYPASNVIFAAQNDDPAKVKQAKDPSVALNPLESAYGQWIAVENSALALAEVANLLMAPGRKCSNGLDVPLKDPNWPKFVQGLRDAGMAAYKAAQSKNQDNIVMAADTMTTACANCHDKWREKANLADRCK